MKQRVWLDRELPPPLEADREKEAIYAFKVEYNMEARELLIEHGLRLVLYVVNGFSYIDIDLNELLSVGTIGLIKAVDAFEPEKGSKLASFIRKCAENEILLFLKRRQKFRSEVSLNTLLDVDEDGKEMVLAQILSSDGSEIFQNIELEAERQIAHKALSILNGREEAIVKMRFGFGMPGGQMMTQGEVADALGLSQSYVSRIEIKALKRMRRWLEQGLYV